MRSQSPLAQTRVAVTMGERALSAESALEQKERPPCFPAKSRPRFFFCLSVSKVSESAARKCRAVPAYSEVTVGNRKSALMASLFGASRPPCSRRAPGSTSAPVQTCTKAERGLKIETLLRLLARDAIKTQLQLARTMRRRR